MRPEVVGLRFLPTDQELVIGYLLRKLTGMPLPSGKYVFECDLYGGEEPWEIWARFRGGWDCSVFRCFGDDKDEDLYILTLLKKKTPTTTKRFERSVGSSGGSWHAEDSGKVSTSSDGQISWVQKRFCYERKKKKDRSRNQEQEQPNYDGGGGYDDQVAWIMHEYTLNQPVPWMGLDGGSFNRYALCRIRKRETPESKKRKLGSAVEPPRVYLVEIDEEEDLSEDAMMEIAPPAALTTTTSFSDHSVSAAATATTSSHHAASTAAVAPRDLLAQVLNLPNPDWDALDFSENLLGDEFRGVPVELCFQRKSNALSLSC